MATTTTTATTRSTTKAAVALAPGGSDHFPKFPLHV